MIAEWGDSRTGMVEQDQAYWSDRPLPDPTVLFKVYWVWKAAPQGTTRP